MSPLHLSAALTATQLQKEVFGGIEDTGKWNLQVVSFVDKWREVSPLLSEWHFCKIGHWPELYTAHSVLFPKHSVSCIFKYSKIHTCLSVHENHPPQLTIKPVFKKDNEMK